MSTPLSFSGANAAANLVGKTLDGGWVVTEKYEKRPGDTGGNFSINYRVERPDGTSGFCKVINYSWIMSSGVADPVSALREATEIFEFERDVARECVQMSKVITAVADGSYSDPEYAIGLVSYIIFEVAEFDVRRYFDLAATLDAAMRLRVMHHLAVGVRQLHTRGIAHQDIKPSNTLIFAEAAAGRDTKVGDLGRATLQGRPMRHDLYAIAGDPTYAPPEGLYDSVPTGFGPRRLACDLYQLGGMLTFVFTGVTFNAVLATELHPSHHWASWSGEFDEVLPYVRDAFGRSLEDVRSVLPGALAGRVVKLIATLCEPNPMLRGNAAKSSVSQYGLIRVITELDLLVRFAEIEAREAA